MLMVKTFTWWDWLTWSVDYSTVRARSYMTQVFEHSRHVCETTFRTGTGLVVVACEPQFRKREGNCGNHEVGCFMTVVH